METIIVGDIGGTNSRFAFFTKGTGGEITFHSEIWEATDAFASFAALLAEVKSQDRRYDPAKCQKVVLAVPGPVTSEDRLTFPNVKWPISRSGIGKLYPATTFTFINDFIAQAFGCLTEAATDARPIIAGNLSPDGANDLAIVGAGTGTGHGALKAWEGGYLPFPSEAGHAHFPFTSKEELEFRDFLAAHTGTAYPICDTVVSGPGLSHLHQFLTGRELSPDQVARELSPESATTRWFSSFYARACRNFALTALAAGGRLFVSGGVAIKNPFLIDNDIFRSEFLEGAGNFRLLHTISVSLIRNEKIGLYGAAYYACKK